MWPNLIRTNWSHLTRFLKRRKKNAILINNIVTHCSNPLERSLSPWPKWALSLATKFKLWLVTSKGLKESLAFEFGNQVQALVGYFKRSFKYLAKMSIEFGNQVQALVGYVKRPLSPWPKWGLSLATMCKLWSITSKGLWVLGQMTIEFGNHDVQALVGYFNTSFQALRKRFKESINYMQKIGKELSVQATHSSTSFFFII